MEMNSFQEDLCDKVCAAEKESSPEWHDATQWRNCFFYEEGGIHFRCGYRVRNVDSLFLILTEQVTGDISLPTQVIFCV